MKKPKNKILGNERICIITGATSGIGRATAFELSKYNMKLILIARNNLNGIYIVEKINKLCGKDKAMFIMADITNFLEIYNAVIQIKKQYNQVDILINNAGARFNMFKQNANGIELTFATNHLGHFLLTLLLLESLKASPSGRIINVSSDAHCGYSADFDYIFERSAYDRKAAYGRSKLANLMFTYELARRLADTHITVNAVHPGGVATNISKNNGWISWGKHYVYYLLKGNLLTSTQAAKAIIYLALSDEVKGVTGKYFYKKKQIPSSVVSYEKEAQKKLWDLSLRLVDFRQNEIF